MADWVSGALSLAGIHTKNKSGYPTPSSRYLVITNNSILGFSRISGLSLKSSNVLVLNEGGTDRPYLVSQPQKEYNIMTLEKGFGTYELMRAMAKMKFLMIIIRDHNGSLKGAYYFKDAVIKDIKLSDLEAKSSEVLIQTMTIAYHSLKRQDLIMNVVPRLSGAATGLVNDLFGTSATSLLGLAESYITADGNEKRKDEKAQRAYIEALDASAVPDITNPEIASALSHNEQARLNADRESDRLSEQEQEALSELEKVVELD